METLSHSSVALTWLILSILSPVVALFFAYKMKSAKVSGRSLLLLMGLQLCLTGIGYLGLETGGVEEEKVEGLIEKKLIQDHESASEVVVGLGSLATLLSITLLFIDRVHQLKLLLAIAVLGLFSGGLGLSVHQKGSELVSLRKETPLYDKKSQGILEKVPGQFSSGPSVIENESLKPDENDYEPVEDDAALEDEGRQED